MRKTLKLIILLILVLAFSVAVNNNYYNLRDNIQSFLNSTFAFASEKTNDLQDIISNGKLISDDDVSSLEDSGITGDDYTQESTYYPYYELLSSNEKTLYKQIYANMNSLATTFVPTTEVSSDEVNKAIEAVYNDHPELFWLNTSYSYKYTANGNVVQIILSFNDTAKNIDSAKNKFNSSANKIINGANKVSTNYEKEKYVHNAIIKLASYDLNSNMNQSAYSALVNGSTVCAGYARAFQYIMIKLGIPTYYVTGTSNGEHAWNIVRLSDGYYNVDLTWDDSNGVSYTYFNLTDKDFASSHTRTGSSVSLPACTATKYRKLETKSSSSNSTKKYYSSSNKSSNSSNSNNSTRNNNSNNANNNYNNDVSNSNNNLNYNTNDYKYANDNNSSTNDNIDNSNETNTYVDTNNDSANQNLDENNTDISSNIRE